MRKATEKDFEGKTIESVNLTAVNMWSITFTDGTTIDIWAELGNNQIPNLLVSDGEE